MPSPRHGAFGRSVARSVTTRLTSSAAAGYQGVERAGATQLVLDALRRHGANEELAAAAAEFLESKLKGKPGRCRRALSSPPLARGCAASRSVADIHGLNTESALAQAGLWTRPLLDCMRRHMNSLTAMRALADAVFQLAHSYHLAQSAGAHAAHAVCAPHRRAQASSHSLRARCWSFAETRCGATLPPST